MDDIDEWLWKYVKLSDIVIMRYILIPSFGMLTFRISQKLGKKDGINAIIEVGTNSIKLQLLKSSHFTWLIRT